MMRERMTSLSKIAGGSIGDCSVVRGVMSPTLISYNGSRDLVHRTHHLPLTNHDSIAVGPVILAHQLQCNILHFKLAREKPPIYR